MESKITTSFQTPVSVIKPSALAENLTKVKSTGIIIGKLNIAIKVALLVALEAIAETKVKVIDKPVAARINPMKKAQSSRTGLPITKPNNNHVKRFNTNNNSEL